MHILNTITKIEIEISQLQHWYKQMDGQAEWGDSISKSHYAHVASVYKNQIDFLRIILKELKSHVKNDKGC